MQITHCPQCATAFKVSPEQLQQAKGWVRCGRCDAVFEAHKHWEPAPLTASLVSDSGIPHTAYEQDSWTPEPDHDPLSDHLVATTRANTWGWAWGVLAVLALLALMYQWALWQRHWLMAEEPGLRKTLAAMCAPFGCEVHWPREPESLVIDSSSFSQRDEGGYMLSLRLKNIQHHPVATPALELTLTDLRDDVVLRRVFTPEELSMPDHIAALRDARSSLNFDLDESVSQRVTGYRALIFYP